MSVVIETTGLVGLTSFVGPLLSLLVLSDIAMVEVTFFWASIPETITDAILDDENTRSDIFVGLVERTVVVVTDTVVGEVVVVVGLFVVDLGLVDSSNVIISVVASSSSPSTVV